MRSSRRIWDGLASTGEGDGSRMEVRGKTRMTSRLRIIVTGLIAQYPLGGVTWDYFQYVLGLAQLGHDVYYIEDTGQWPYNPVEGGLGKGCDFNVEYLAGIMSRYGLADQWAYRFPWQSQWFGLSDTKRQEVIQSADLLINISGTLERPEEYRQVRRLAYIDSDPVFTQVKLARGQLDFRKWIDLHDVQFSFGECLSSAVPATGYQWRPTRQPIVLSEWHPADTPPRGFHDRDELDELQARGVRQSELRPKRHRVHAVPGIAESCGADGAGDRRQCGQDPTHPTPTVSAQGMAGGRSRRRSVPIWTPIASTSSLRRRSGASPRMGTSLGSPAGSVAVRPAIWRLAGQWLSRILASAPYSRWARGSSPSRQWRRP